MLIDYPDVPRSVGRFEGDAFEAEKWKPEYPNSAFDNMRPDDAFWAAKIVSKFSDETILAIVRKAAYSDPAATDYIARTLIKRRDKVLATWLNQVNPVVEVALDATGALTFANASVDAKAATPAESYSLRWFQFDNATGSRRDLGAASTVTALRAQAPAELLNGNVEYAGVTITAAHPGHSGWARPATVYFRRTGAGWTTVGIDR
jgi:hypothetical protein